MSWDSFKRELKPFLDNPSPGKDITEFAKAFTNAYDNVVKQGSDLINGVSLLRGNKTSLEFFTVLALVKGRSDTSGNFNLVDELGKGIISYWTGATLNNFPIPTIPAPGSTSNVSVTQNIVVDAGQWPKALPLLPSIESETFLNAFVLAASIHLYGIKGVITTVSLYPPLGNPAPGFINWTGYRV